MKTLKTLKKFGYIAPFIGLSVSMPSSSDSQADFYRQALASSRAAVAIATPTLESFCDNLRPNNNLIPPHHILGFITTFPHVVTGEYIQAYGIHYRVSDGISVVSVNPIPLPDGRLRGDSPRPDNEICPEAIRAFETAFRRFAGDREYVRMNGVYHRVSDMVPVAQPNAIPLPDGRLRGNELV